MISFVWSSSDPLVPGAGGTEAFTLGQSRELTRRGIKNQIVSFFLGKKDGREHSPDVKFVDYDHPKNAGTIKGDVVLITEPIKVKTEKPAYVMMHSPPIYGRDPHYYKSGYDGQQLVSNSHHTARTWADYLEIDHHSIEVMHPFADEVFGKEPIPKRRRGPTRVLFAGRMTVEKGFYTLLEALHFFTGNPNFVFTAMSIGKGNPLLGPQREIIEGLANAHPQINVIPGRNTPKAMAELLASQDIVVMPSHSVLWPEPFGMLSVEAQHSGCRVVASAVGGLPETDCGGLHLFEPDNPVALATTIRHAAKLGRLTDAARHAATKKFTVAQSVDRLLAILKNELPVYRMLRPKRQTSLRSVFR